MEVYVSRKTLFLIAVFCAVCIAVLVLVAGAELLAGKGFVRTTGTVVSAERVVDTGAGTDNVFTVLRYYTCEYKAGARVHQCRFRTLLPFLTREGASVRIAYDPANPDVVTDRFKLEICLLAVVFFGVFLLFLLKAMTKAE